MGEEKKKVPLENEDIKEVKEGEEKQKEKSKEIPPVIKKPTPLPKSTSSYLYL